MFAEIRSALRPAVSLLLFFTLLTGIAYPFVVTGIAQAIMPHAAKGSLIETQGRVIGSELIGQNFTSAAYFHGRPSAAGSAGYDASASSGSNLGPGSKALKDRMAADMATLRKEGMTGPIPADLVTTSASGLDPEISPEAALAQVPRIAKARAMRQATLRQIVAREQEDALLGLIGEPRVNVLALNMQLDRISDKKAP